MLLLEPLPAAQQTAPPVPAPAQAKLDRRFQEINEIFTLGDVYFSNDRTLALTGIATWCGALCGSAQWMIYEKLSDGAWVKVRLERDCKEFH